MSKYIDTDSLRKEIGHRIDILADMSIKCAKNDDAEMHAYYHGKAVSLQELLSFIDSFQQEQPFIPDLDEAAEDFVWEIMENDEDGVSDLCRKLYPTSKITDFYDALAEFFKAGAEWQKNQMLKEAVEGEIQMRYSGCLCAKTIRAINEDKFKLGDKVRIIIVK